MLLPPLIGGILAYWREDFRMRVVLAAFSLACAVLIWFAWVAGVIRTKGGGIYRRDELPTEYWSHLLIGFLIYLGTAIRSIW